MKKVAVIGAGYVGFPLACSIAASKKYDLIVIDKDSDKVDLINDETPNSFDDSEALDNFKKNPFKAYDNYSNIEGSDFIIICVPTPVREDKLPDYKFVLEVAKEIKHYIKKDQVIILESTVNPGFCDEILIPQLQSNLDLKVGIDFHIGHCPERIDPGNSKYSITNIPRNISTTSPLGTKIAADFYRDFLAVEITELSNIKVTEATKILENTFRDVNIAFVNELAKSFDKLGIDILEVIRGASTKPFGFMPFYPGCGVGGHCIPVDPYYLIENAKKFGFKHSFLILAREINNSMPIYAAQKLIDEVKERKEKVALLGLSYKANIGDFRESPSYEIRDKIIEEGFEVITFDPYMKNDLELDEILELCKYAIVATDHREFLEIENWKNVEIIVDGRNKLDKEKICGLGIKYIGIGRAK